MIEIQGYKLKLLERFQFYLARIKLIAKNIISNSNLVKYLIVGVCSYILELSLFTLFIKFFTLGINLSSILAFLITLSFNFLANKKFTFKSGNSYKKELLKYLCVALLNLFLNLVVINYLIGIFKLESVIAKIIQLTVAPIWTYLLYKFVVFKKI